MFPTELDGDKGSQLQSKETIEQWPWIPGIPKDESDERVIATPPLDWNKEANDIRLDIDENESIPSPVKNNAKSQKREQDFAF